ncbi:hypothetical protein [Streptomyces scopuliridis]|uniref:hypothetical protein n=1 Tax=Streptomyces scopuliridis TaxID=452529 RepID=UPI0035D84DFE
MTLMERDGALALMSSLLAESSSGRGRTVVVAGGIALGKSTVLQAFAERAVACGALAWRLSSVVERGLELADAFG